MQTEKKLYWIFQLVGWTGYSSLIYLSAYINRPEEITSNLLIQLLFMIFLSIFFTHVMKIVMLKMDWVNKKLIYLIPRLIFVSVTTAFFIELCLSLIEVYVLKEVTETDNIGRTIVNVLAISLLIICWNGIYYTYHFFQKSRNQEIDNLFLQASKNEIELKNLRSQLNPHFLFNSLNSIRALIDIEPKLAKSAVTTLSQLLRKSLISGKENLISLEEEIEIIHNYLELEKIRFEERLDIIWEVDNKLNNFQIPPFCIQTIVENAVKHGISNEINGGFIKIKSFSDTNSLFITVENSGKLGSLPDTGIGIENIQRRLAIQFQGKANFSLLEQENTVLATLKFDYENH